MRYSVHFAHPSLPALEPLQRLIPRVHVLEPHHVRNVREVSQEQELGRARRGQVGEQRRRENPVGQREPGRRAERPEGGAVDHLLHRVIVEVDAAVDHRQGDGDVAGAPGELPQPLQEAAALVRQPDGRDVSLRLLVTEKQEEAKV